MKTHAATRSRLGGVALLVGGLLYGIFWLGPVLDMDLSIVEHPE